MTNTASQKLTFKRARAKIVTSSFSSGPGRVHLSYPFIPRRRRAKQTVCLTIGFSKHNNAWYADLFPRLNPLVRFHKLILSRHRILRGVQYRRWRAPGRKIIYPRVLRYMGQRYETLFTQSRFDSCFQTLKLALRCRRTTPQRIWMRLSALSWIRRFEC
jgi:hypothetical protein